VCSDLVSPVPRCLCCACMIIENYMRFNASFQHSRPASTRSSPAQDILFPGDIIGQGLDFRGERVRLLPVSASHPSGHSDLNTPSVKFGFSGPSVPEFTPLSTKSVRSCLATHRRPKISSNPSPTLMSFRSMTTLQPFATARESILALWPPSAKRAVLPQKLTFPTSLSYSTGCSAKI